MIHNLSSHAPCTNVHFNNNLRRAKPIYTSRTAVRALRAVLSTAPLRDRARPTLSTQPRETRGSLLPLSLSQPIRPTRAVSLYRTSTHARVPSPSERYLSLPLLRAHTFSELAMLLADVTPGLPRRPPSRHFDVRACPLLPVRTGNTCRLSKFRESDKTLFVLCLPFLPLIRN